MGAQMRVALLLLLIATGGWYILFEARKLDEVMVREFYKTTAHAVLSRDTEAQCALWSKDAVLRSETRMSGHVEQQTLNQRQACEHLRKLHKFFVEIADKVGGTLTIEYDYELTELKISANRNTATVVVKSTLKMGEELMQFHSVSTEQLARRWGRVELVSAEAKTKVNWSPAAIADPVKYLKSE
jgi:hypothetical protein